MAKRKNSWALMAFLGSAAGAGAYFFYFQERAGANPPLSVRPAAVAAARAPQSPPPTPPTEQAGPTRPAAPTPAGPKTSDARQQTALDQAQDAWSQNPGIDAIFAFEKVIADSPDSLEAEAAARRLAEIAAEAKTRAQGLASKGEKWQARNAYSTAYFASQDMAERAALAKVLDALNDQLIFSGRGPDVRQVTVASGDSLGKIARREKVAWRGVRRINKIRGTTIRLGQKLKLLKGALKIEVSTRKFELTLTHDGYFLKRWIIGIGKEDRTPIGGFTIKERIEKPVYYSPEGPYPFGHEKNVLGTRWLGFNRTAEVDGFGIHGTKFPESVGTKASMGCIRMRNEDVELLFDFIPAGCAVRIR